MQHAHKNYNIDNMIKDWDSSLTDLIDKWQEGKSKRWTHKEI